LNDLEEWRKGKDEARFVRMVDGRGKQLGDPATWLAHLFSICTNPIVIEHYPDLPDLVVGRLRAIRLKLPGWEEYLEERQFLSVFA
jgi:hypothetical protein